MYLSPQSEKSPQPELNSELVLDMSQLHFGSHSSGGHVAVEFLKKGCSDVKVIVNMKFGILMDDDC